MIVYTLLLHAKTCMFFFSFVNRILKGFFSYILKSTIKNAKVRYFFIWIKHIYLLTIPFFSKQNLTFCNSLRRLVLKEKCRFLLLSDKSLKTTCWLFNIAVYYFILTFEIGKWSELIQKPCFLNLHVQCSIVLLFFTTSCH